MSDEYDVELWRETGDIDMDGHNMVYACPRCDSNEVAWESLWHNEFMHSDQIRELDPEFVCGDCGAHS